MTTFTYNSACLARQTTIQLRMLKDKVGENARVLANNQYCYNDNNDNNTAMSWQAIIIMIVSICIWVSALWMIITRFLASKSFDSRFSSLFSLQCIWNMVQRWRQSHPAVSRGEMVISFNPSKFDYDNHSMKPPQHALFRYLPWGDNYYYKYICICFCISIVLRVLKFAIITQNGTGSTNSNVLYQL